MGGKHGTEDGQHSKARIRGHELKGEANEEVNGKVGWK